jgi:hypothetical protein
MKIGMMGAWNTDSGASIHAELVGRAWVEKGIELKVFSFYRHAFHGTALTKKEDEPYVTRCFAPYGFQHLPMNANPLLEEDFDIFVAQDLGMLPMAHLLNIFPQIRKKAKTVNVVHDGELSRKPEYFQFDWDHVVCFDDRYYDFLKDAYPEGILSRIPYPSYPLRPGDMKAERKELNLPMDKKIILLFGQAAEHALNTSIVFDRLADRYDICLLLVTEVEKVLSEFRRIQNRIKFDFKVVERSPDQELLYKYLHASDCMVYNKHYAPVVVVGSTIFQCLGSMCPILARDTNYVYSFNREVMKHKLYYDLEENLIAVFEKTRKYQVQQESVKEYLAENAAEPTADKFLELFEDLLKKER